MRQFIARYRMHEKAFNDLAETLRPDLEGDASKSAAASGGAGRITAEIKLSAVLRFLAGGAWQDIVDVHQIGESTLRLAIMEVWGYAYWELTVCCAIGVESNAKALPSPVRPRRRCNAGGD